LILRFQAQRSGTMYRWREGGLLDGLDVDPTMNAAGALGMWLRP
jgi:hypothetical protein